MKASEDGGWVGKGGGSFWISCDRRACPWFLVYGVETSEKADARRNRTAVTAVRQLDCHFIVFTNWQLGSG